MKYHVREVRVVDNVKTGGDIYLLTLAAPAIAAAALPGQFIHLRCGEGLDPFLRRPFSIYGADRKNGLVQIWYQVVGKGTDLLREVKAGKTLDVTGPLGKGFFTDIAGRNAGLVGGGMGIAPLMFLGGELAQNNRVHSFFGVRSKAQLPPGLSFPTPLVATEDGSAGRRGLVTDVLEQELQRQKMDILYACGPRAMLQQVVKLAQKYTIPLQVSLESAMACGVGACLGCACEKSGADGESWLKACQDGPVFWAAEVKWE